MILSHWNVGEEVRCCRFLSQYLPDAYGDKPWRWPGFRLTAARGNINMNGRLKVAGLPTPPLRAVPAATLQSFTGIMDLQSREL
jgi:hypothetical protein